MTPRATYRLQFHAGFTFADAALLAPYLAGLGVSHVYASPIGTARAGSTHGYDQIDPTRINPELGGEEGFRTMVKALKAHGLGVIVDIVPNHMAVGHADNAWWLDVLKHGPRSAFAQMFDIDWSPADPALRDKLLAPFLGAPYAQALAAGDIVLKRDADAEGLSVWAHDAHRFPLRPEDQDLVALGAGEEALAAYDGREPAGRARLHALLERQPYRLACWRTAGDEINWRRFFDITELAGLRIEREAVFDLVHQLPLRLYSEGLIDGVRVDHVDGLADPGGYCRQLRVALDKAAAGRPADASPGPAYLVVEKILAPGERLPANWRTDGTTGYDYMNLSAALLHDPAGEGALTDAWVEVSGRPADFGDEERRARRMVLERAFAGQLEAVTDAFHAIARADLATRDIARGALRRSLVALLCVFPVYRTYGRGGGASPADRTWLATALADAQSLLAPGEADVANQIVDWLAGERSGPLALRADALRRFEQLSAPLSAKAVEDTAFYRYGRLLSRNDVGSDPQRFAIGVDAFHGANLERAMAFPHALLATATHDHKRGEDVRARLAVVSEDPQGWIERIAAWTALNARHAADLEPGDLYQLYQTLVGAWPMTLAPDDAEGLAIFRDRVARRQRKALREAKLNSSWSEPDTAYERAARDFLQAVLDPARSAAFLRELHDYVEAIAPAGAVNGLVQALLRCTAPGTPDLYQGCEGWDLSLVDPDNRRAVDYASLRRGLAGDTPLGVLLVGWRDGRIKQRVIACALGLRRRRPALFGPSLSEKADYTPLQWLGERAPRLIAYGRLGDGGGAIVVAPLRSSRSVRSEPLGLDMAGFADARLQIPDRLRGRDARNVLTGERIKLGDALSAEALLTKAPVALLEV